MEKIPPTLSYYPEELPEKHQSCPNLSDTFVFLNTANGTKLPVPCNKYSCPYCGRIKIVRLQKALTKYFMQYEYSRLFTFTITSRFHDNQYDHYKLFAEAWRRFTIEVRRNKALTKTMNNFQYVRVAEQHISGYIHYHVLINCYMPVKIIHAIWENIVRSLLTVTGHVASVQAQGRKDAKAAAKYVCKYVMKNAKVLSKYLKKWTKSGRVSIFEKRTSSGQWMCINLRMPLEHYFPEYNDAGFLYLYNFKTTSQALSDLSPPELINILDRPPELDFDSGTVGHEEIIMLEMPSEIEQYLENITYE